MEAEKTGGRRCPACGADILLRGVLCHVCGADVRGSSAGAPVSGEDVGVAGNDGQTDVETIAWRERAESPVPGWRWTLLIVNSALLCVWLALTAWNWHDPPRHVLLPAAPVPTVGVTPTPTNDVVPVVTVPAVTPRPTATHASGSGGKAPAPAPSPTPAVPPAPTATSIPTPPATPTPMPTVPTEG